MSFGKSTYLLRFESNSASEMLADFVDKDTVGLNLNNILPTAIDRGFVPRRCSQRRIELEHNGRLLNRDLPLSEQGVREHDTLILRDLAEKVKIDIKFTPDNHSARIETITVDPSLQLRHQADAQLKDKLKSFRFYGRKLKKYSLVYKNKKLNLRSNLRSLNIHADFETTLKPRIWFEWPPRLIWPPGPFTTYTLALTFLIITSMAIYWFVNRPRPSEDRWVLVECKSECKIYDDRDNFLGTNRLLKTFSPGEHRLILYHRAYPIYDTTIFIDPRTTRLEDTLELCLDAVSRFTDTEKVELRISAFNGNYDSHKYYSPTPPLLINRFTIIPNSSLSHSLYLCCGDFEIKYDLPDSQVQGIKYNGRKIIRRDFIFNLREEISENHNHLPLTFWYIKDTKRGNHASIN